MEEEFAGLAAKRTAGLATDVIQGKTTIAEVDRSFYISPCEIEEWGNEGLKKMVNALRAIPLGVTFSSW
ncbi:transposase [Herbaspirillum frisingense]|uniref:transposase n=1 Tax=Herbaspirillum frisingense TaxID=92645 RepID=UPI001F379C43|nr:transposase [Herbaspirillum frisingense]UIN20785.1 transposase [Herbaspirillum frisingense]